MIFFKGQLSFKQYMKNKPTNWGIKKSFVLSNSKNGYVYCMEIHAGKKLDSALDVGLFSRVVLELMSGLEGNT